MVTIFQNIFSKTPYYVNVDDALERIRLGKSQKQVDEIRQTLDKEKANELKANLPSVCFSGKFAANRKDSDLIEHSGFIVLDFDNVADLREKQTEIISHQFVYACWVSPSGNGLKALVRILQPENHREHFAALRDVFPEIDKSGANPSRVCYESYDTDLYVYPDAEVFSGLKSELKYEPQTVVQDDEKIFKNILQWLTNKNEAFVTGERNNFIFKLASACCRFGLAQATADQLIQSEFLVNSDFSRKEADRTIRSAYRANQQNFGTAKFEREMLVEKDTKKEIKIDSTIYDESIRPKDVIYGIDVKDEAMALWMDGYPFVRGIGVPELDKLYKEKPGEITLLSGIGNYGKSSFWKWRRVMRYILYGERTASFSPEDNPPEEFYHSLVEILLGAQCTPENPNRPSSDSYEKAFDFISKGFFYLYPKDDLPTPDYIKERFLEIIVKEKVTSVCIDPFNQLANDYGKAGGRSDKYLEGFLGGMSRFAQNNEVDLTIIAHPHKMQKHTDGNYPCPDVFDIADGAMWNNKMDNIIIYHRPLFNTEPRNPLVDFSSKKIKRQPTVGIRGFTTFEMDFRTKRFIFSGVDPMADALNKMGIDFGYRKQSDLSGRERWQAWEQAQINGAESNEDLPF